MVSNRPKLITRATVKLSVLEQRHFTPFLSGLLLIENFSRHLNTLNNWTVFLVAAEMRMPSVSSASQLTSFGRKFFVKCHPG